MFKQSRFFLQFYHSKGLFRIRKQQKSDFQKFFEISLEDKPTKSKLLSYYILLKKKPSYKTFKVFLLFNVAIFFGLLIIPGSKIAFQYKLKLTLNDIYTDIIFTLAILHNESSYLDYVGRNILDSLLLLSNEGIYEVDYTVKNIDRINRLIEEMPISENTLRGTLVNMGALIKFIIKEKTDTLIEPDFQESLMEFMNLAVAKSKFEDSANFLKDKSNLLNEEKFVRLIDSYKEIVNLGKVLLGYQKDAVKKAQIYKYLVVLLEKENSEIFKFEEIFTNLNGLYYMMRDLKEENQDLNLNCLQLMTLIFRNENAAIIMLKTRIVSNLIKHILMRNESNYQKYIETILEIATNYKSRELLLTYSQDFEPEKQNLNQILKSPDFSNAVIKKKLEAFLSL